MRLPTAATAVLAATLMCTPLLLTGCAGGASSTESEAAAPAPAPAFAEPVTIITKVSGDQLPIESYGLGLLDDDALDGLGLRAAFADAGVPVDLSVQSVLLLSLGQQSTGGFAADITGLQLKGDELYVQGTAVAPGPNAVTSQQITYPYCAVVTVKLPEGVELLSDITSLP